MAAPLASTVNTDRITRRSRRAFLQGGATAGAIALAGCLGGTRPASGTGLSLQSLEVGGSPGGTVHLRREGTVSLLDFFATWCTPCKPQMAELRQVRSTFDESSLHQVSITSESDRDAIRSFWTEYEGTWPVVLDTDLEANQRYDVTGIPTMVLIDEDGTEHWRHTGLAAAETVIEEVRAVREA